MADLIVALMLLILGFGAGWIARELWPSDAD